MRPTNVELHIEELVLHGFSPGGNHHLRDTVEHELARLFAEHDVPYPTIQNVENAHINGGEFYVAFDADVQSVGAQVALAVFRGLTR